MKTIANFGGWMTKWFTCIVVAWAVINYFLPELSLWAKSYTNYLLSIVLFGMGLTLDINDFKRIIKMPLMIIVGTIAHYVIMPLLAVFLCWVFHLDGMLAVGVILVGCCPSGTSSNVMSFLSRGDVALDVSIGLLSTLCAPFAIPILMETLASQYVEIPTQKIFLTAFQIVVIPVIAGVTVHTLFAKQVRMVTPALPAVSQLSILLIIGVVVAANNAKLISKETALLIPVVILHNLLGYLLGYIFSRLMHLVYPQGFRYAQQKAITFEVGMQDSALGATLALKAFAAFPIVAIPSTFFSVWHNISGSVLSAWWRRHDDRLGIDPNSLTGKAPEKSAEVSTAR
ncbi:MULTISPECIES: bile acid:sodium symporter family protein [Corynebacterium]|uniref:bile acid:sodium symporter family protein n=1 Tax=Corynebacterium TaxID=1716 RepID=UPI00257B7AFD|nr:MULTISPECIES: bile acid:sodium symporter family protein [Corynebacterium]MDN6226963.1 bile acid:sodium symporter family protein [Corynebacterium flavescens]MDN6235284.1 bile acid:sodium symporter family protein [Corynebacterium flavescens]